MAKTLLKSVKPARVERNDNKFFLQKGQRLEVEGVLPSNQLYEARGGALELWKCRDEEILIEGPAGTGKTRAILEKMHLCAMKYPNVRLLMVRKTRESMSESVLVTFEEKVVPPESQMLWGPQRNLRQKYWYPNKSILVVNGMDKSSKIMSSEYDMIAVFEGTELTEEDHENLTTRLRNGKMPYQQILVDCNPDGPSHWLNRRASVKMKRILSRHEDNPYMFNNGVWTEIGAKYIKKLDRLSGARYLRLRKGLWAAAEGRVYEDYDGAVHLKNRDELPASWTSWRKIRTIDFGFQNPFVCQWWAINEDNDMYLYRQIYKSHRIVADHAITINKYSEGETYEATLSDHDSEDRATLEREGIFTMPAFKAIKPGIEAVQQRLRYTPTEKPRIFILRDSLVERDEDLFDSKMPICLEDEFDSYVWPKDTDSKKIIKEVPVDKDNHGMDSMRYGVAYVDDVTAGIIKVVAEPAVAVKRSEQ